MTDRDINHSIGFFAGLAAILLLCIMWLVSVNEKIKAAKTTGVAASSLKAQLILALVAIAVMVIILVVCFFRYMVSVLTSLLP